MIPLAVVVTPLVAALFCAVDRAARIAAAIAALGVIGLSLYALATQPAGIRYAWAAPLGSTFAVALDPAGALLAALCGLISLAAIAASEHVGDRRPYFALHCIALAGATTAIAARDLAAFFVAWEVLLLSIAVLIRRWGTGDRQYASVRLLVHGLIGSGLFLVALASMADARGTLDIDALAARPIGAGGQLFPAVLLLAAFAPALALFPFHGWSPRVFASAGPGVTMLLPGLLATAAAYGTLRICLGLFPQGMATAAPVLVGLATVGALYGATLAARQDDMRRGIAFLAMSQQRLAALGIFTATANGLRGAVLLIIAGAISTSAALVVVDALARRASSALLSRSGGLDSSAPRLAALTTLASLAAIGVPGTAGFAAAILSIAGTYERYPAAAAAAAVTILLSAAWAATLARRALHGPPLVRATSDVRVRELAVVMPLLLIVLILGVAPRLVLDRIGDGALPAVMTDR